jgi:uncharacterized phiE125 gp8 family phage protein
MRLRQVTAAATPVLTMGDVKPQLGVLHAAEDGLLDQYIQAVESHAARLLDRALLTSTWELELELFPVEHYIRLPLGQLQSVTSFTFVVGDGAPMTVPEESYEVRTGDRGSIELLPGRTWPAGDVRRVFVCFVAGWPSPAAVPAAIKQAMRLMIRETYYHQEAEQGFSPAFRALLVNWIHQ